MTLRQRIISEIYDERDNKVVDGRIIEDKKIETPVKIDDLGYNHQEQIKIIQEIQGAFLFSQSKLITPPERCYKCGERVNKSGYTSSDFHAVYTDHKLEILRVCCCNKNCAVDKITTSISALFGSNMHPDLAKKQAEVASEQSFIKAQEALVRENGRYRTINNQLTIKKTADKVGLILNDIHQEIPEGSKLSHAERLIVQVDGGHIKSCDKTKNSFEALVSSIYRPKDHEPGGTSKNGIRKSGTISSKIYVASTYKDRGKTIKAMTIAAAKKHGMTAETKITGLSDGASNCWSTIQSLAKHCASIECVLDWYHISMKFDQLI